MINSIRDELNHVYVMSNMYDGLLLLVKDEKINEDKFKEILMKVKSTGENAIKA